MSFENATYLRRGRRFVGVFDHDALDGASGGTDDAVSILLSAFPARELAEEGEEFDSTKQCVEGAHKLLCLYEERSDGDFELRGAFNAELVNKDHLESAVNELNNSYCSPGWKLVEVIVDYTCSDVSACQDILQIQ